MLVTVCGVERVETLVEVSIICTVEAHVEVTVMKVWAPVIGIKRRTGASISNIGSRALRTNDMNATERKWLPLFEKRVTIVSGGQLTASVERE